jgi:hypothetical protein
MATVAAVIVNPNFSNLRAKIGGLALARGRNLEDSGRLYRARPWLLFANFLSTYDLARAVARYRIRAFFQVFSLALGLIGSLILSRVVGPEAWLLFLIASILSLADLAFEIKGLREEDDGCDIFEVADDIDWDGLLGEIVVNRNYALKFKLSCALYIREVNEELSRQCSLSEANLTYVAWSKRPDQLPVEIQKWRRQILLNRYKNAKGNRPFNGALVRQSTSAEIISNDHHQPIAMQPTRYFDLMCSNYLTESYVEDRRTGARVVNGLNLIRDTKGHLPRLENSHLANPIGVSTLAFDSNNKLILIQQSAFAQSSRNLWSPSGSGSLEPDDILKTRPRPGSDVPLVDVIRRGMNRELIEESHIREGCDR